MGTRENNVESYLTAEVRKLGGDTRKWTCPGRAGVPDRIICVPGITPVFVEVKTDDGKLSSNQKREHQRLRTDMGLEVFTVHGHEQVDTFITVLKDRLKNASSE